MAQLTVNQWIRLCKALGVPPDIKVDLAIYKAEILQKLLAEERKRNTKKGE